MQKQKVIIDADPGIDDSLALLMALNSPELDVIGISIVAGNVPVTIGVQNALKVLQEAKRLDIPVFAGATHPQHHEYVSAQDTHGMDGLGESDLSSVEGVTTYNLNEVDGYSQLLASAQDVWFMALGPLTNVAASIQRQPALWQHVSRLIIMGGAYKTNGNTSPVAEYNLWVDPDAADYVLQNSPIMIELVPLDVTRKIVMTPNILQMMQYINPEKSEFVTKIIQFYFDFHWQQEHVLGAVINDPLVVFYALHPKLSRQLTTFMTIVTSGIALGQSIVDIADFWHEKPNAILLQEIDARAAMAFIIARLLNISLERAMEELDNIATDLECLS